tara:strand:- start:18993 stop:19544 length:552 start_codon:yes stop_codon:yes gene_type:complete
LSNKEIKSEIIKRLSQGDLKSELFDQYKDDVNEDVIRTILASRPSYLLWQKFKRKHLLLSLIWGFFIFFELFRILELVIEFNIEIVISIILSTYITINIWKFDGRFFLIGIIWFSLTIVGSFIEMNSLYYYNVDYKYIMIFVSMYSIVLSVGIYLMYHLRETVFSYMEWFRPFLGNEEKRKFE